MLLIWTMRYYPFIDLNYPVNARLTPVCGLKFDSS